MLQNNKLPALKEITKYGYKNSDHNIDYIHLLPL